MLDTGFASAAPARPQGTRPQGTRPQGTRPETFVAAFATPAAAGRHQLFHRDEALFWEGDEVDGCYRVVSGAVRLCQMLPDGRRQISDFFGPGDLVLVSLADRHAFTAEAIVDSVICHYPRATVDALLQSDPRFSRQLLSLACDRLVSAHQRMAVLGRKTAEERLASFLVACARRLPAPCHTVNLPMSRSDIADYLGLTVETVSRVLSKLKRDRVIDLPDIHSIVMRQPETLERISEGE